MKRAARLVRIPYFFAVWADRRTTLARGHPERCDQCAMVLQALCKLSFTAEPVARGFRHLRGLRAFSDCGLVIGGAEHDEPAEGGDKGGEEDGGTRCAAASKGA